jgi:hypothetical protein
LHAEPVSGNSFFVVELEGCGDGTGNVGPGYVNDTRGGVGEGGEGVGEEVEVVEAAAWAFVHDLKEILVCNAKMCQSNGLRRFGAHTIAVMVFPEGPVTDTQAPQFPELSQLESESAVPRISDGRV